jgi:8-oxo-dGTP diphosphatase
MPTTGAERASRHGPGLPGGLRGVLPVETARLRLRFLAPADAPAIERLAGEWEVARFTGSIPHPYPAGGATPWIAETWAETAAGRKIVAAIERRVDGAFLGCIELDLAHGRGPGLLGYWVGRPFWGAGIAVEAGQAMIEIGFGRLGLLRIEAAAMPANRRSIRVQEKLGFAFVAEREEPAPARGEALRLEVRALDRPPTIDPAVKPAPRRRLLVSAVALVDVDGRVLLARRPAGKPMAGLWEFPGGKVHEDETPEQALIRELKEELAIDVAESCLAPLTFASHRYPEFDLLMPLYVCRRWQGTVVPLEGQEFAWVRPPRLADYPMPPADMPLIAALRDLL